MNNHNDNQDLKELATNLRNLACGFVALAIFFCGYLWWLNVTPILSLEMSLDSETFYELRGKGFESIVNSLQFLATGFGGVAILSNVYYAAKRATAMEKTAQAAEKNVEVVQNSQITERFTKAVEQLGSDNLSIRLGGIYALEKIAQDAPETYHWTIMEILCAFIRNHELSISKKEIKQEKTIQKNRDLQAALMVIGRRNTKYDSEKSLLDLRGSNLSFTQLDNDNYNFSKAVFYECNFTGIKWNKVHLQAAFLNYSDLTNALFYYCDLTGANLEAITITKAKFNSSNLQKANFEATKTFGEAGFRKANLEGTNFSFCDNLTEREIKAAIGDETTILPGHLTIPKNWKKSNQ
ncbi:MAG: pentapeptide repeat-containing protein [Crocosphaera sp.]|nr:pentapeptide repeat-containing protein [Crocosphaera sp.]